jgi:lysophospholipase L1-like esterase
MPLSDPIGSSAADVLVRNASDLDTIINSDYSSIINRVGSNVITEKGRQDIFQAHLAASNFEVPVQFAAGLTMLRLSQTVLYLGKYYSAARVNFTTTSTFVPSDWVFHSGADESYVKGLFYVANVPDLRALVPLFNGQLVQVSSYTTAGDGGIFTARWNSSGVTSDNGITTFKAASLSVGLWESEVITETVNAERLGISPTNTAAANSSRLDIAIPVCLANDVRTIHFSKLCNFDSSLESRQRSEITFSGVQPIGLYRKLVQNDGLPPFIPQNDIFPQDHLWKARNIQNPTVVLMGDSISTSGPDGFTTNSDMWSVLCSEMLRKNPSKTFKFLNRSIGGQTWLHANTKPTAFPYAWYYNTALDWLDIVKNDAPDIIFLAFGMNDANGFNAGAVNAVVNKITSWPKVPNIIFITNPVPALSTSYLDGFGYVAPVFQEGRDQAAGYVRGYAKMHGYGLIDINRAHVAMRDGYDNTKSPLYAGNLITASKFAGINPVIDWGILATINRINWPVGKVLSCKTGVDAEDNVFVVNEAGYFKILGFSDDGATVSITTTVALPTGNFEFGIGVVDNTVLLVVDRMTVAVLRIVRQGGSYLPILGWQTDLSNGPFTSFYFSEGYPAEGRYKKSLTDENVFGKPDNTAARRGPYGGNGINHYSSMGVELLVRPSFEVADLTIETKSKLVLTPISITAPVTTSTLVGARTDGNIVYLAGLVQPTANAQTICTLPVELRPSIDQRKVCVSLVAPYSVLVKIFTTGVIQLEAGWTSNQLDLSSISYNL